MGDPSVNLGTESLVAFVATTDLARARRFYVETLGLHFVGEDDFAVQVRANGVLIRIAHVPDHPPAEIRSRGSLTRTATCCR